MSSKSYHLPEECGHLAAVLEDRPDEERSPGVETALVPIQAVSSQHLTGPLGWMKGSRGGGVRIIASPRHLFINFDIRLLIKQSYPKSSPLG